MTDEPYQPQGYCPDCGYHMDPGTCPECGSDISPGNLDKEPCHLARRRMIRYGLWAALAVALLIAILYAWYYPWERHLSNATLLKWQGEPDGQIALELVQRFKNNQLSNQEGGRLLHNLINFSDDLNIRTPHPANKEIMLVPEITRHNNQLTDVNIYWMVDVLDMKVYVDNRQVPILRRKDYGSLGYLRYNTFIEALPPGRHAIRLEGKFNHRIEDHPGTIFKTYYMPHVWEQDMEVCCRAVADYVTPVWSQELADQFLSAVRIQAGGGGSSNDGTYSLNMVLRVYPAPSHYAAIVQYRLDSDMTWNCWYDDCDAGVGVWTGSRCQLGMGSVTVDSKSLPQTVDIRLVPSAAKAYDAGFDEYFNGIIECENVPVETNFLGWDSRCDGRAPTRIVEYDPDVAESKPSAVD